MDRWVLCAAVIAGLVILPIVAVIWLAFFPTENIWPHLIATSLPRYLSNSLIIMGAVALLASVIGTFCAWMVVTKEFPMRRILEWALLFPLAIPAYIGAYAFVDFWEYAGPAQTLLRDWFGWVNSRDYYFPAVRCRDLCDFIVIVPLCLSVGAGGVSRTVQPHNRGGAGIGRRACAGILGCGIAVGTPCDCDWNGANHDGSVE